MIPRITAAEYNQLPETVQPMALLNGYVYVYPTPYDTHQHVLVNIVTALMKRLDEKGRLCISPLDIRLDDYHIIQPDLLWVSGPDSLCQRHPQEDRLIGAPDLVCEIVSAESKDRDYKIKFPLYEKHGVRECWFVDPDEAQVEVYSRQNTTLSLVGVYNHTPFLSPVLQLEVDPTRFFLEEPNTKISRQSKTHAGVMDRPDPSLEMIEGEIYRRFHHVRHDPLIRSLRITLEQAAPIGQVYTAPQNVRFSAATIVQPDVFWVSGTDSLCQRREDDYLYGAPDLVCEILSPSTAALDKRQKFTLYEKHGVKEYWLLDPANQWIEVYTWQQETLTLMDVYHKTIFTSPLLQREIDTNIVFIGWLA